MTIEKLTEDTVEFYNKESAVYTQKRYPKKLLSYSQYIFKKRLAIFIDMLETIEKQLPQDATLLEMGCADGVLFKAIEKKFPGRFSKLVGADISTRMIDEAKNQNNNSRASFYLRDKLPIDTFDLAIELGVHTYDLDAEAQYISGYLKQTSYFMYSAAGGQSLHTRFKLRGNQYALGYMAYDVNDRILENSYTIKASKVYGLFVPKLWKFPSIARVLQPVIDVIFERFVPELFHEKLYVLVKNGEVGL